MDLSYLVNQIKATPQGLRLRQGEVVTHDNVGKTINIRIAGDPNVLPSVKYLDSYQNPTAGDVIFLLTNGADILVLGHIAS
jgi:hypothetical protein